MEIKILNWLIQLLDRIKFNISEVLDDLLFMKYEREFGERPDDIYVITYMKSGTTWMQMILYQMLTDGNTDFEHIYDVSPWLRNLAGKRGKLPENLMFPRIIKSHDPYRRVAKGKQGRFIYVIRDGIDVANSLWHHRRNYIDPEISYAQNFEMSFIDEDDMNWFNFNRQWIENKNGHNIPYIKYEDLQHNFDSTIDKIAAFLQVSFNADVRSRIKERASFAFMKQHETKFGEQPPKKKAQHIYDQFIRSGKTGEGFAQISDEELSNYLTSFAQKLPPSKLTGSYFATAANENDKRSAIKTKQ